MLPIQNFYTGLNAGIVLPDTNKADRSLKDFYNVRMQENAQNLKQAQERQQQFLDYTDITPIQTIADQHQALQATWINDFENKAKEIGPTANYSKLMELKRAKNDLIMKQQNLKANQDMYIQDRQKVASEAWKYPYFKDAEMKFLTDPNAQWDRNLALKETPESLSDITTKLSKRVAPNEVSKGGGSYFDQKDGTWKTTQGTIFRSIDGQNPVSQEELRSIARQDLLTSPKDLADSAELFKRFMIENPKEAQRYFDMAESDGVQGTSNIESKNAIVEWVLDNTNLSPVKKSSTNVTEQKDNSGNFILQFGVNGYSKDKKGTFEIVDGLKSTAGDEGSGVKFDGNVTIGVPASIFKFPDGYNATGLVDFRPNTILNGVAEGTVSFRNPVYGQKWVPDEEADAYKQKRGATDEELAADPSLKDMSYVTYTLPPKDVTVRVPLDDIKGFFDATYNKEQLDAALKNIGVISAAPTTNKWDNYKRK